MDIKVINEAGQEQKPQESLPNSEPLTGPTLPQLETKAIGQLFGYENETELSKYKDEIQTLLQFAKSQTQDHSFESLKWVIRSLELKLGTPPLGENRLKYIRNYAYLLMEEKRIKDMKEKYERI